MIRLRRVEDVAILDWTHKDVAAVVPRLRSLVESREAHRILLNMSEVESLKGEGLETLTEALSVCEDGGCVLGMFGLNTYMSKLLEIMDLGEVMPALVGPGEGEAITAVRALRLPAGRAAAPAGVTSASGHAGHATAAGGRGQAPGLAEVDIEFEPQTTSDKTPTISTPRQASRPPAPRSADALVEFDLGPLPSPRRAQQAPAPGAPGVTIKFDRDVVASKAHSDEPDDLLAVFWVDLASQGVQIGGPGAREINARARAEVGGAAQQPASAPAPSAEERKSKPRQTQRISPPPGALQGGELEIDLDPPAPPPRREAEPPRKREFKTEVIAAFEIDPETGPGDAGAAPAAKTSAGSDTADDSLEVDFEPVRADEVGLGMPTSLMGGAEGAEPQALFGGGDSSDEETSDWSPLDTDTRKPPVEAAPQPPSRSATPPRPLPARAAPSSPPLEAARLAPGVVPRPSAAAVPPAAAHQAPPRAPATAPPAGAAPVPAALAPAPARGAPQPAQARHSGAQPPTPQPPGTPVAGMPSANPSTAPAVARSTPAPLPAPPAPAQAPMPDFMGSDGGDETVMFQPDGLLAEVLAAVAPTEPAVAGPSETSLDVNVREKPPAQEPAAAPPIAAAPAPEPAAAPPAAPSGGAAAPAPSARAAETKDELKKFLADYAIVSELHLRVLDKFSREGIEKVLGRPDIQSAVGGSAAGVASILEDFVQARLVRRRRSPRVRGGTGFLYAPSPKTRNAVTRLLRLYEDGASRAEVLTWIQGLKSTGS